MLADPGPVRIPSSSTPSRWEALRAGIHEAIRSGRDGTALRRLSEEANAFASDLQGSGWRGLPELLRLLASGLTQRILPAEVRADDDLPQLDRWFDVVSLYSAGGVPSTRLASLVDELEALAWVPDISQRLRQFIVDRLRVVPIGLHVPATTEDVGHPEAAIAPAAGGDTASGETRADTLGERVEPETPRSDPEDPFLAIAEPGAPVTDVFDPASAALVDELAFETMEPIGGPQDAYAAEGSMAFVVPAESADDREGGEAGFAVDAPLPDIWIAREELELTAQAIEESLMPSAAGLMESTAGDERAHAVGEYRYSVGLFHNAMELLGLTRLHAVSTALLSSLEQLASLEEEQFLEQLELLLNWQVTLLGFLRAPDDGASAELIHETLADPRWRDRVDPETAAALAAELPRIRVGRDPSVSAAAYAPPTADDVELRVAPDVLPSVLDGMLRELPGNATLLGRSIHALVLTGDSDDIDQARRVAHTLKGDANTVGLRGIANLAHALEDILVALARSPRRPPGELARVLEDASDCLEAMADHVLGRAPAPDDALDVLQRLVQTAQAVADGRIDDLGVLDSAAPMPTGQPAVGADVPRALTEAPAASAAATPVDAPAAMLSVPVTVLDELLRLSSETIVVARQVEERLRSIGQAWSDLSQQGASSRELVAQLDDLVALRGAALQSTRLQQGHDVDALELDQYNELHVVSRRLIETTADSSAHLQSFESALGALHELSVQQDRVQLELQTRIMSTRSVPATTQVPRFARVVRQTARTLLKEAELEVVGADTAIDSDLLDRITEPLVHALRNAVDHGIEAPEERVAAGKPRCGRVRLEIARRGGDVIIRLADDGRGIDHRAIRARAETLGMLAPGQEIDRAELERLILLPGFSTRSEATHTSGRGIGMDVVARRVAELRGSLVVYSEPGRGTSVDITLPASLVSAHIALARSSAGPVAVTINSLSQFVPIAEDSLIRSETGLAVRLDGDVISAEPLEFVLGAPAASPGRDEWRVGLLVSDDSGRRRVVLAQAIDEMRSVIVKSLGPYVAPVRGVRGVTVLGTGGVAPVVDLAQLISGQAERPLAADFLRAVPASSARRVIVVDDSLSVRRALEQVMADAGFSVATARDGLEALELVRREAPVAAFVDLEMPRMNGLELTTALRNTPSTADIPIFMITSRDTERHRQLAEAAGVTALVGKPYDDDALVAMVRSTLDSGALR